MVTNYRSSEMKLIKKTYLSTLKWLLPAIIIGIGYSYLMIEYIEHEETDEFLTYEMERLKAYHKEHGALPEYHKVADILPNVQYKTPIFRDTLMLEPGDNEMVPYRELLFSIKHKGKDFTIVLRHLLLGRDDMLEGTLLIVTGLLLVFILFVLLALRNITGKVWNPFYNTLDKLVNYNLSAPIPTLKSSNIEEFEKLNKVVTTLLDKISKDYQVNKEFNENISHELQTHLAIIRTKTEKLLNAVKNDHANLKEIKAIYSSVNKLSQIQRSLVLLNKIEIGEFNSISVFNLKNIVQQSLTTFEEVIQLKEIKLTTSLSDCEVNMDAGLAEILISNLIKNAIVHNIAKGTIEIHLSNESLTISNSSDTYTENPKKLLNRFEKGKNGTTGIGLSIVNQICQLYHFKLDYQVKSDRTHIITISFEK